MLQPRSNMDPNVVIYCDATGRFILPGEWYYYDDEEEVNICHEFIEKYRDQANRLQLMENIAIDNALKANYANKMTTRKTKAMSAALKYMQDLVDGTI